MRIIELFYIFFYDYIFHNIIFFWNICIIRNKDILYARIIELFKVIQLQYSFYATTLALSIKYYVHIVHYFFCYEINIHYNQFCFSV